MKLFKIFFADGNAIRRFADDEDVLRSELSEEFPNREIVMITVTDEKEEF